MGEIIKYPTHIFEKERELSVLEFNLSIKKLEIERKESQIKSRYIKLRARNITYFMLGSIFSYIVMIYLMTI